MPTRRSGSWKRGPPTEEERRQTLLPRAVLWFLQGRIDDAVPLLGLHSREVANFVVLLDGYDDLKEQVLQGAEERARERGPDAAMACRAPIYRALLRDTVGLRAIAADMENRDRWMNPERGRGMCRDFLLGLVEAAEPSSPGIAIDSAESKMMQGGRGAPPGFLGNPVLARLFEARGDPRRALATIRRRVYLHNTGLIHWPYSLKEEGRLAAMAGDEIGAIRAYEHYLLLRSDPDPGLLPEVDGVRAALHELRSRPAPDR